VLPRVSVKVRRTVFGRVPATYQRARLGYPPKLWRILERTCGLGPGVTTFEIGPGTGKATRELLRRGAGPLTLVEADPRLVRYLRRELHPGRTPVTIVPQPFERARLPAARFDLGVAATSFHWLPPTLAYRKVGRLLRPGGWFASWNNRSGDPFRPNRFMREVDRLYRMHFGRPAVWTEPKAQLRRERKARRKVLGRVGLFDRYRVVDLHWEARMRTSRVVALWSTFAEILVAPVGPRRRFLTALRRLVRERFHGAITLRMFTPMYLVRRRASAAGPTGSGLGTRRPAARAE
jgi:SAM-dependent methyltransferase